MKKLEKKQRMEKKEFILSEPKVVVNGTLDNSPSDWVSLRDGNGLVSNDMRFMCKIMYIEI